MDEKFWVLFLFILLGIPAISEAQLPERPVTTNIPQQSVYIELGGNGLIYSLNYDVLFQSNWGFRLGGAFFPSDFMDEDKLFTQKENSTAFMGIVMGYRALGSGSNKMEIGSGILFGTIYDRQKWDYIEPPGLTFSLGYRYYPEDPSHFTFKIAFTPVINRTGFHPGVGISLGITLTPAGDARVP